MFSVHWCSPCRAFTPPQVAIRGIPTLVIFGADGKVITRNGRGDVGGQKDEALAERKK